MFENCLIVYYDIWSIADPLSTSYVDNQIRRIETHLWSWLVTEWLLFSPVRQKQTESWTFFDTWKRGYFIQNAHLNQRGRSSSTIGLFAWVLYSRNIKANSLTYTDMFRKFLANELIFIEKIHECRDCSTQWKLKC